MPMSQVLLILTKNFYPYFPDRNSYREANVVKIAMRIFSTYVVTPVDVL